jgi:hypothetical protein
MKFRQLIPSVAACILAACSAPMVTPDGPTMQPRAGYVKDWDELAERTASQFVSRYQGDKSAVFVAPGPSDMPFASAYRKLLEDKLLQRQVRISETAVPASTVVTFSVQTFLYAHDGRLVPVLWTPVAGAFDALASLYDTTKAEVLFTVSVSNGDFLSYRDSAVFYVRPSDLAFYSVPPDGTHCFEGNCASGILAGWPESWDALTGDPTLDALPGPERKLATGMH